MFSAFFGNYLLNEGVVSAKVLEKVLSEKNDIRLKLGMIAINESFMNAKQVEEVHNLQAVRDLRFGEIAIEEGYLTEKQLDIVLCKQKSEQLLLAQALVNEKILTMAQFEEEIKKYKRKYSLSHEQFEGLEKGDVEMIVDSFITLDNVKKSANYKEYITLFIKNLVRFVDSDVRIDSVEKLESKKYKHMLTQKIDGKEKLFTAIAGESDTLIKFAEIYAEEEFNKIDEFVIDAVGEYMNVNNGLYVVNKSITGTELIINVQDYHKDNEIVSTDNMYCVPLHFNFGKIDLLIK